MKMKNKTPIQKLNKIERAIKELIKENEKLKAENKKLKEKLKN